jgi:Skp family chaperone for outer membrane proteins
VTLSKNIHYVVLVVATLFATAAMAETKIAVMNYQSVMFNSVAATDATLQLRSNLAPAQKALQDISQQIESRQGRLSTDRDILTDEEVQTFNGELQALFAEQTQITSQMQQAQQNSRNAFIQQYQPIIRDLVSKYIEEKTITLVIDAQAVLWNSGEPDITEDLLQEFDAWYQENKTVAVPQE